MSKHGEIVGYTFKADNYCPDCIIGELTPHGFNKVSGRELSPEQMLDRLASAAGIDREDEQTFDTDDFPKVVLYEQARGAFEEGGPDCCGECGRVLVALDVDGSGPGKFEGNGNQHLAAYLHETSLDGSCPTFGSVQAEGFHLSKVGSWIVEEDFQGFVTIYPVDELSANAHNGSYHGIKALEALELS